MPRYDFRALDGAGAMQTGSLDAPSPNDVVRHLASRGMRVQYVGPSTGVPAAPTPQPQYQAQPRPNSVVQAVSQVASQVQAHPGFDAIVNPASSRDKDVYFIFTQLGNILRSGLNPAQAMEDLSRRQSRKGYADAFRHISQLVAQGTALSTAMSLYPQIFPPGACGAMAAGETGGYLPDACEQVAQEAQRALKLKRLYWWVGFIFWSNLISLPLLGAGAQTIDATLASINTQEGTTQQGVMNVMGRSIVHGVFGPWGLLCLLLLAAYLIGGFFARRWYTRGLRHQLAASLPLIGQRTKGEVGAAFAWHLEKLGRAGISPYRAWNLAAKAVPNMASSEKLMQPAQTMTESTRLSEGFHRTNLFPTEMAHVMETGEMTGSMGRALEDARQMSQSQQQTYQAILTAKAWVWMGLILIAAGALGIAALYGSYLNGAVKHGLSTGEEETQSAGLPVQGQ